MLRPRPPIMPEVGPPKPNATPPTMRSHNLDKFRSSSLTRPASSGFRLGLDSHSKLGNQTSLPLAFPCLLALSVPHPDLWLSSGLNSFMICTPRRRYPLFWPSSPVAKRIRLNFISLRPSSLWVGNPTPDIYLRDG